MNKPIFEGLIFDEQANPVSTSYVGEEPCYVVDDNGFMRHIPSVQVDRQIFESMGKLIEGHEELISEQTAKMLGQDDLFSRAIILNQLKQIDKQLEALLQTGLPEETRAYLGMMGFKIIVNIHGEVVDIQQPGLYKSDDE